MNLILARSSLQRSRNSLVQFTGSATVNQ